MPRARPLVYWDSTIWIAYIKDERRVIPGEREGVLESAAAIQAGRAHLLASQMIRAEVLEIDLTDEQRRKYAQLLNNRRFVSLVDTDHRIHDLVKRIREYYIAQNKQDNLGTIGVPDATHLATAVHYQADALYTFDEGKRGKSRSLLALNGNVAGHALLVCKPPFSQYRFPEF